MLKLTVEWQDQGLQRRVGDILGAARDVNGMLRAFGAEAKADSAERFAAEGPGWPEREPASEERIESQQEVAARIARRRAITSMQRKLRSEFSRARRKFSETAVERRYVILKEFERRAAGGAEGYSLLEGTFKGKSLIKAGAKIDERFERAEATAKARLEERGRLLGGLAGANVLTIEGKQAVVRNKVRNKKGEPYSAVHNDGGEAGHGAKIKKREFLSARPELLDKLPQIALDRLMRRVEKK